MFWGNDPGRQERPADSSKSRAEYPSDENRERRVHSECKRKAERSRSAARATCRSTLVANDLPPYHRLRHRTIGQSPDFTRLQDSSLRWWGRWDLNPRHPPSLSSTGIFTRSRISSSLNLGRLSYCIGFWSPSSFLSRTHRSGWVWLDYGPVF